MSDDGSRIELTRRRLLGGIAVTGVATAGAGAGTWSYLQDTESSTDNKVQAGTLDLGVTNGGSLQWTITGKEPGGIDATDSQDVHFYNSGTTAADHLEIGFSHTPREDDDGKSGNGYTAGPESDPTDGAAGMAQYVKVTNFTYDNTSGNTELVFVNNDGTATSDPDPDSGSSHPALTDTNGNGFIDLEDLAHSDNQNALDNITPVPPTGGSDSDSSTQTTLHITLELDSSLPNDYQGDVLNTTVTFGLLQNSSQ